MHVHTRRALAAVLLAIPAALASGAVSAAPVGHAKLAEYMIGPEQLDAKRFPTMTYTGRLQRFVGGAPTEATGELTMHGVTRPVALKINMFKCIPHPLLKREWCGADASGTLDRSRFGLDYAPQWGFKSEVTLRIQVEARAQPAK
jgi:polyisoprenoid-binding protein YceI